MDTSCVACGAKECRTGYQRCWDCWEDWNGAYRERITDEEYRRRVAKRRSDRETREAWPARIPGEQGSDQAKRLDGYAQEQERQQRSFEERAAANLYETVIRAGGSL